MLTGDAVDPVLNTPMVFTFFGLDTCFEIGKESKREASIGIKKRIILILKIGDVNCSFRAV